MVLVQDNMKAVGKRVLNEFYVDLGGECTPSKKCEQKAEEAFINHGVLLVNSRWS